MLEYQALRVSYPYGVPAPFPVGMPGHLLPLRRVIFSLIAGWLLGWPGYTHTGCYFSPMMAPGVASWTPFKHR